MDDRDPYEPRPEPWFDGDSLILLVRILALAIALPAVLFMLFTKGLVAAGAMFMLAFGSWATIARAIPRNKDVAELCRALDINEKQLFLRAGLLVLVVCLGVYVMR